MDLNETLIKLKGESGLTTDMLAKLSGVPKGTINKILNGETRNPTARTLSRLSRALGYGAGAIYEGEDAPSYELREDTGVMPVYPRTIKSPSGEELNCPTPADSMIICDFALRAADDSMSAMKIDEGDMVFITRQDDVEDGQIACLEAPGKIMLAQVYHLDGGLILVTQKKSALPVVKTGKSVSGMRITGRATAVQSFL